VLADLCPAVRVHGVEDADGECFGCQRCCLVGGHPTEVSGLICLDQRPAYGAASKDECDDASGHVLVDAGQSLWLDVEAGFFADFAA
jgi:hypothetical protein